MKDFLIGVTILSRYQEPKDYWLSAAHDIIYTQWDISEKEIEPADLALLSKTSWHYNTEYNECWAFFT